MSVERYKKTLAILKRERVPVQSHEYPKEAFGSWVITCDTSPPSRVVWDGKEQWLVVQTKIDRWGHGKVEWVDQLLARAAVGPTGDMAVAALIAATS
jgi:hypothetical protein